DHMRSCRESSHVSVSTEILLKCPTGDTCLQLLSKKVEREALYHTAMIDLTERKEAEAERLRALEERQRVEHQEELTRAANEAKDGFLAMLSHELRTPLTPILLSLATLRERRGLPRGMLRHLEMIRRNIEFEAHLIDDLLDVTRIKQQK